MNKYITEFVGTFFLVLTIGCTGIGAGAGVIAPLAIGAALMVMVFAGGHISGGHYNPAVTLGVLIRGKVKPVDVVPYWIAQFLAAAVAALLTVKVLRAVMTGAFAVGDISGGAFNPAVALGITLLGISSWHNIWIYLVANFGAAVVAAVIFQLINPPMQTTPIATPEPPYETPR